MCCDERAVHTLLFVVQYLRQQPKQHSTYAQHSIIHFHSFSLLMTFVQLLLHLCTVHMTALITLLLLLLLLLS